MTTEDGDPLPPPPPDLVEDLRRIAAREDAPDSVREAARSYLQSLPAAAADSGPLRAEARVTVTASADLQNAREIVEAVAQPAVRDYLLVLLELSHQWMRAAVEMAQIIQDWGL